jgi:integrase
VLKTKSGLPRFCCWAVDRHGKRRVRFRRCGLSTYLTGTPWGEQFMIQYAAAFDRTKGASTSSTIGAGRTKPGTVNALVVAYYKSPDFKNLETSTKDHRQRIIERFRSDHGDKPLNGLKREHIKQIMAAKADTPEAANNLIKILRVMLNYAIEIGMIESNPATDIKRYKSGDGFHTWTEDEIAKFEEVHAVGTRARLALALLLHTAQRVSDVCKMGWQHVNGGDAIAVTQKKTGTSLTIPLHPDLKALLAAMPRTNLTFIVTARGAPFTAKGLGDWFKKQCRIAGLACCSAHGLRKAAATRLANAGCSVNLIAAITGHKSLGEVARYTKAADQERLARQALSMIGSEGERSLVQPLTPIVQPKVK